MAVDGKSGPDPAVPHCERVSQRAPCYERKKKPRAGRGSLANLGSLSASRSHEPELLGVSATGRGGGLEHTRQIIVVLTHAPELLAELRFVLLH